MKDYIWKVLEENLKEKGETDLEKENWDTFWSWNNKRQRTIKTGEKGIKVKVKNIPTRVYLGMGIPQFEIDKNGNQKPKIRNRSFNKSFFNIRQTELKQGEI